MTKWPVCSACGANYDILKTSWKRDARWICWGCRIKERCSVPNEDGGCWIWLGARRGEYGIMRYNLGRTWKFRHAHRVAYAVWISPIPKSWACEHTCGEKLCCNPAHLILKQQPLAFTATGNPGALGFVGGASRKKPSG